MKNLFCVTGIYFCVFLFFQLLFHLSDLSWDPFGLSQPAGFEPLAYTTGKNTQYHTAGGCFTINMLILRREKNIISCSPFRSVQIPIKNYYSLCSRDKSSQKVVYNQ